MSWDTVSPGYRPLSWGYAGVPRMPPVSQDAKPRLQTSGSGQCLSLISFELVRGFTALQWSIADTRVGRPLPRISGVRLVMLTT